MRSALPRSTGSSTGSRAKKADIAAAASIYSHAVVKKGTTLDYKKANKYDKGKTTLRRQFAAEWLWGGKKITKISKAELKKVKKYTPKTKRPAGFSLSNGVPDGRPSCPGRTGVVKVDGGYNIYLDKCDVTLLQTGGQTIAMLYAAVAIAGQRVPPVAAASGTVAILAQFGTGMLGILQDWSPSDSVWVAVRSTPIGLVIATYPQV